MNFKKLMLIVIPLAIILAAYQFMNRVDRSDPVKVATAFTKALKSQNMSKAAGYFEPDGAQAWQDSMGNMKSGATERYFERVPADVNFSPAVTNKEGATVLATADKSYSLEMKQIEGKWFVSKGP